MNHVFDIVIDAQNDFMRPDGRLYVPGAESIIQPLQEHLGKLDSRGVLFTYDTHVPEVYAVSEEAKQFPPHCEKGTEGWKLAIDNTVVKEPVWTLEKGVFNMWQEPRLSVHGFHDIVDRETFFDDLRAAGVTKLRFCGVAADFCVKWGIEGALAHGFEVDVIGDLTKGIEREMRQVVYDDFRDRVVVV